MSPLRFGAILFAIFYSQIVSGQGDVPAELRAAAERELQTAESRWNVSPRLVFSRGNIAEVTRADEITIGAEFITKAVAGLEPAVAVAFMRFVVLHEMWHVRQLDLYGADIRTAGEALKRVYECQADIMSSTALMESDLASVAKAPDLDRAFGEYATVQRQLLPAIARQAARDGAAHFHLSSSERWMALRLGGFEGSYATIAARGKSPSELDHVARIARIIAREAGVDQAAWSLDWCKRITKYGQDVFRLAIDEESAKVNFNVKTDNSIPGLPQTVTWTYKNKSNRPVRLSFATISGYYPQNAPEDYQARQYFDGATGVMKLQPGETQAITRTFRFFSPNPDRYLIFGGTSSYSQDFLVTAEYTAPAPPPPPIASCSSGLAAATEPAEARFLAGVMRIAASAKDNFSDLPHEVTMETALFQSWNLKIEVPGSLENRAHIVNSGMGTFATITVYRGTDIEAAKAAYSKLTATMKKVCTAGKAKVSENLESTEEPRMSFPAITASSSGTASLLTLEADPKSRWPMSYTVNLFLRPTK